MHGVGNHPHQPVQLFFLEAARHPLGSEYRQNTQGIFYALYYQLRRSTLLYLHSRHHTVLQASCQAPLQRQSFLRPHPTSQSSGLPISEYDDSTLDVEVVEVDGDGGGVGVCAVACLDGQRERRGRLVVELGGVGDGDGAGRGVERLSLA